MLIKREIKGKANDLNTSYRPYTLDELIGNEVNKNMLKNYLNKNDLPHTLLFIGERGCGKTTVARIVSLCINCKDPISRTEPCLKCDSCKSIVNQNSIDVQELNIGQLSTKGSVEETIKYLNASPFNSKYKVFIFDEAHKLSPASIDLLLKKLEDGYEHVYFIFCTNKPEKITNDAFLDRCHTFNYYPSSLDDIYELLLSVSEFEGIDYKEDILKIIAEESEGIPRKALVSLSAVNAEGTWDLKNAKMLLGSSTYDDDPEIIELSRLITKKDFDNAIKKFDGLFKKFNIETIRISIMSYMVACLKRSKQVKFSNAIDILSVPIAETGKPGKFKFYNVIYKLVNTL